MAVQKKRILFIERQASSSVSIERVFSEVARNLSADDYDISFQKLDHGNGLIGIIRNLITFRPAPADIYHITGHIHYLSLVLPPNKTILTIHDLVFLHCRKGLRRWALKKLFLDLPIKKLRYITTISGSTKDEICSFFRDAEKKIRVIENPVFSEFVPGDEKPFDVAQPMILQIGTAENKNLSNLVKALAGSNFRLRIIGTLNANIINELNAAGIVFESIDSVGDGEIANEYRKADIISFCSTYEGFGLPIIEAQAMRKPVITSNIAPMNLVAGEGAVLVDPADPADMRNGFDRLINNASLRNECIKKGIENIKRFSPDKIAESYAELYKEILRR